MKRPPLIHLIVLFALLTGLVACGGDDDADPTSTSAAEVPSTTATSAPPTPTEAAPDETSPSGEPDETPPATLPEATATEPAVTATEAQEPLTLSVYYLRGDKLAAAHRRVPHTLAVGAAAMEQLLAGPTGTEADVGFTSAIPDGTVFLGLEIHDGVASVDLSEEFESGGGSLSMAARLAQVVFTLTQFPTVESVEFSLNGEPVEVFGGEGLVLDRPVGRANYEDLIPAIFVESPTVGDSVESPLRVWGTANTFEATFILNVVDPDGAIIVDQVVTATSGTGTRGTFDITVEFEATTSGTGAVIVFERSARDGQPVNVVEIPVEMPG